MDLKNIIWNEETYKKFIKYLWSEQDKIWDLEKHSKILNIPSEKVIGIRTPIIKKIAKEISKGDWEKFISLEINDIYEEKLIKGLVLTYLKDYDIVEKYLFDYFDKYVDSWAICDVMIGNLKIINKNKEKYFEFIKNFYLLDNPWLTRIELVSFLGYYTDDLYLDEIFDICKKISSEEYYIKMGLAWLLSVLFVKQRDRTLEFLKNNRDTFDVWTYNKTLQKIIESLRVSSDDKLLIKKLKIKK